MCGKNIISVITIIIIIKTSYSKKEIALHTLKKKLNALIHPSGVDKARYTNPVLLFMTTGGKKDFQPDRPICTLYN